MIRITTTGNLTIDKKFGNWGYNNTCLFYKDTPICYKVHGLLVTDAKYQSSLRRYLVALNLKSCIFNDSVLEYEALLSRAITKYKRCAENAEWIDDTFLQLFGSLNIKFENQFLEFCKKLPIDKFLEASKKHSIRRMNRQDPPRTFDGIWYRAL